MKQKPEEIFMKTQVASGIHPFAPHTEYNLFMSATGDDEGYVKETLAKFTLVVLTGTRRFG